MHSTSIHQRVKKNSFRLKEVLTATRAHGWRKARSRAALDDEFAIVDVSRPTPATNSHRKKSLRYKPFPNDCIRRRDSRDAWSGAQTHAARGARGL
ncbi:hypothetical protein ACQR1I_17070 [Bradyrhizobium sp. HKCCYLS2038]|uniref:hypothetical protein n=1 Tax=unclassified Bradyrhizobium TaxID=2631580 RepID=UPI003EBF08C7